MGFARHKEKSGNYTAFPIIAIEDENEAQMRMVQDLLGGSVYSIKGGKAFRWQARRQTAIDIAKIIQHTAPARNTAIKFFLRCENATAQEKVAIYDEFTQTKKYAPTDEDYNPLVRNPIFLAGLIDGRGSDNWNETVKDVVSTFGYNHLQLKSKDKPLLDTIAHVWGGKVNSNYLAGEESNIGTAKVDSYVWRAATEDRAKIDAAISPFRQIKK